MIVRALLQIDGWLAGSYKPDIWPSVTTTRPYTSRETHTCSDLPPCSAPELWCGCACPTKAETVRSLLTNLKVHGVGRLVSWRQGIPRYLRHSQCGVQKRRPISGVSHLFVTLVLIREGLIQQDAERLFCEVLNTKVAITIADDQSFCFQWLE